ncbi:hypothetical protein DL237_08215 [Pseudooceanicola sediminis]|uniref:Uncharacterized protein n=2 Tax=Pseudooceanicola sediminis TaxID=2211117 RepID=A0A399J149_9RHOB|nr:hypothetical protein DL237_08215 [Pseudooceanicola sediminis]|tara:strand:- start:36498 stop:36863 length:366 start_codon:yes stop_codon:yes gene_type:complete
MCLAGCLGVSAVPAMALRMDATTRTFATCTGRLSALMEHQWLLAPAEAEVTRHHRHRMIELLQAVMPQGGARDVLSLRIEAKFAQALLLTRATFNADAGDAAQAGAISDRMLAHCEALLAQ